MVRKLLQKLSNAHGVSGCEGSVSDIVRKELKSSVDEMMSDTLGNLIAVKKGDGFSVMLAAHMDEIGLMVKYIDEKGFIRFVTLGGWYAPTLYNQRVVLYGGKEPVYGVVGGKPPHVMDDDERKKPLKTEDMFIDIGVNSPEEAKKMGIGVGTPITIDRELVDLAGSRVTGKAFDNRVGVTQLISTMQQLDTPHTVYAVCTVQEEVGLKGARTSAFTLDPDCAIALDVTIPGDHPGIEKKQSSLEMGKGAGITIVDSSGRGLIASRAMVEWLTETADKNQIPYQLEVGAGGTTDATAIYLTKGGIPSTTVSVPTRYIHSPVEVVDLQDIDSSVSLLVQALKGKPKL
ncbi:MAG: M42 family metallopeptidase [Methanomicrobiales archaeon]|nr:M42 family metallopeptidase [Methanomicrobiales archaeon]